jgi:transposase
MDHFAGVDVSPERCAVCVEEQSGAVLREAAFEAVLMETRQVKGALKAMPIKTDRRDALGRHGSGRRGVSDSISA